MNGIYKTYANYRAKANKHRMTWMMKMKRDIFAYLGGRKRDGSVERERAVKPCNKKSGSETIAWVRNVDQQKIWGKFQAVYRNLFFQKYH